MFELVIVFYLIVISGLAIHEWFVNNDIAENSVKLFRFLHYFIFNHASFKADRKAEKDAQAEKERLSQEKEELRKARIQFKRDNQISIDPVTMEVTQPQFKR